MPGKRKTKKKGAEASPSINWATLARRGGIALFSIASFVVFLWGAANVRDALRSQIPSPSLATPSRPDWIRPSAWDSIISKPTPNGEIDLHAQGRRWAESPWVRDVRIVRQGALIQANISFRKPVQSIDWGSGLCTYTDRDGIALALDQMTREAGAACLTVQGIPTEQTRPVLGKPLSSDTVKLTGELADQLSAIRVPLELDRLIVSPATRGSMVDAEILSMSGGRIVWGKLQKNAEPKIQALRDRSGPLRASEVMDLRHLDG